MDGWYDKVAKDFWELEVDAWLELAQDREGWHLFIPEVKTVWFAAPTNYFIVILHSSIFW